MFTRIAHPDGLYKVDDNVLEIVENILKNAAGEWTQEFSFSSGTIQDHYYDMIFHEFGIPYDIPNKTSLVIGGKGDSDISTIASFMLIFLKSIPIYEKSKKNDYYNGMYFYGRNVSRPHIDIYSENISGKSVLSLSRTTRNDITEDKAREIECAATIIHELAHAVMDPCNYRPDEKSPRFIDKNVPTYCSYLFPILELCEDCNLKNIDPDKTLNFYTFREESLAEYVMHEVIKKGTLGANKNIKNVITLPRIEAQMSKRCEYGLSKRYYIKTGRGPGSSIPVNILGWMKAKCEANMLIPQSAADAWMIHACCINRCDRRNVCVGADLDNNMPWKI